VSSAGIMRNGDICSGLVVNHRVKGVMSTFSNIVGYGLV
jgi:hypothetical protein